MAEENKSNGSRLVARMAGGLILFLSTGAILFGVNLNARVSRREVAAAVVNEKVSTIEKKVGEIWLDVKELLKRGKGE